MSAPQYLAELCWPSGMLGACIAALVRKARLTAVGAGEINGISDDLEASVEWHSKRLGCDAQPLETTYADLETELSAAHPVLLKFADGGFLAILDGGRRTLRVLTPGLLVKRVALRDVCAALRTAANPPGRPEYEHLLAGTDLPQAKQAAIVDSLLAGQIGGRRFEGAWILRVSPGAPPRRWLRQVHVPRNAVALAAAHGLEYLLLLASWAILGRLSFRSGLDRSSLVAWGLLLLALVPFRLLTTWLQGLLAAGLGKILKRRLLWGALRLEPDEVRHQGLGSFLGQSLEAEAVETLALSGGIAGLLALIEIAVAALVLGRLALLLFAWSALTLALAWRFLRRYRHWNRLRMAITQDLVEAMVGYRTRLAQQQREDWHRTEDAELAGYFGASHALDTGAAALSALIPRGWLLAGLACLAPALAGGISRPRLAILLAGILLAYNAFRRLTASLAELAAAWIAWRSVAPLFSAAARRERLAPVLAPAASSTRDTLLEAHALSYSYSRRGKPALEQASIVIRRGERLLLEGSSGGGKSTFASLLAGLRLPDSGQLLLHGRDRRTVGDDDWRKHVVAAPQFHENHVLTGTLAFNVLMGRAWPPRFEDMQDAEALCRELGLGDLLARMPAGIMQIVGEGGWQLSHGERSRIYVARALLQGAELVILDESFAALDPENLKQALECALRHAPTLMVVAHP